MTITTAPIELREGQGRHRARPADLWNQERQRENRARTDRARHRMADYLPSELRGNARTDGAQHRACRGEDALSA